MPEVDAAEGHAEDADAERARIAEWLARKADETEELLMLAAERGDPEAKATQMWFAKKTRIIIASLAVMVGRDMLVLRDELAKAGAR